MPEETADAEGPVEAHEMGPVPCCLNASERVGQNLMFLLTRRSEMSTERVESGRNGSKEPTESIRLSVNVLQTVCLQRNR